MNAHLLFDKLAYVDRLKASGVDDVQARAHADGLEQAFREEVATKADLATLSANIDTKFAHVDTKFAHLDAKFEAVQTSIEKAKNDILQRLMALAGLVVAGLGAMWAALKYL